MSSKYLTAAAAIALLCLPWSAAFASPTCTKEPESKWLSEAEMKQKIQDLGYKDIKVFKKTANGCYEIYGYTADNRKAEVYFHPISGAIVENNME